MHVLWTCAFVQTCILYYYVALNTYIALGHSVVRFPVCISYTTMLMFCNSFPYFLPFKTRSTSLCCFFNPKLLIPLNWRRNTNQIMLSHAKPNPVQPGLIWTVYTIYILFQSTPRAYYELRVNSLSIHIVHSLTHSHTHIFILNDLIEWMSWLNADACVRFFRSE